ncbi:MAG: isocitrate lyase/phosphoenolpyruvate mutase family protein [Deltaproteobacteria bacterium]|nr:isocitrate lyase/phosphoenolpyruvate mutase family protein [Deltaproteobacteria bacterium]
MARGVAGMNLEDGAGGKPGARGLVPLSDQLHKIASVMDGGDCIFYVNLHSAKTIGVVVKEVNAPVSILASPPSPSVSELQDLGVARVTYGAGFLKAAIGATKRLAQEILEQGTVTALEEGMQTLEISALVARKAGS